MGWVGGAHGNIPVHVLFSASCSPSILGGTCMYWCPVRHVCIQGGHWVESVQGIVWAGMGVSLGFYVTSLGIFGLSSYVQKL